ncbi:34424_t:CDS:1, partial [Gigaspora margarita]
NDKDQKKKKSRLDIRNKIDRLENNRIKGKGIVSKIYDDFVIEVTKNIKNNYRDDKKKMNI